jgi:hypothetical protein
VGTAATKVVEYTYDVFNRLVAESVDPDGDGEESATGQVFVYHGDNVVLRFAGNSGGIPGGIPGTGYTTVDGCIPVSAPAVFG